MRFKNGVFSDNFFYIEYSEGIGGSPPIWGDSNIRIPYVDHNCKNGTAKSKFVTGTFISILRWAQV